MIIKSIVEAEGSEVNQIDEVSFEDGVVKASSIRTKPGDKHEVYGSRYSISSTPGGSIMIRFTGNKPNQQESQVYLHGREQIEFFRAVMIKLLDAHVKEHYDVKV